MLKRHMSEWPKKGTGLLFFEEPKTEKKPAERQIAQNASSSFLEDLLSTKH